MSDVAKKAGVSKNTVSLALRKAPQISEATRKRVEKAARALGYSKNPTVAHLMAQLRANRTLGFQASLALVNAHLDRDAFSKHPTVPTYIAGCRSSGAEQGYTFDEFWLHDPELDGHRLNKILHARGIRGIVAVGLMSENKLPQRFAATWEEFPCVVTGVPMREPALSFACTDHHLLALHAFENALRLGYKRPAMVLDGVIDELVNGRFTSGMEIAQRHLPAAQRIPAFHNVREAQKDPALFKAWFREHQPDVILSLYNVVRHWVEEELGLNVPKDIGLIQLDWRKNEPEWAGMDQHNDVVGEAAVQMVISMIHNHEHGIPAFPRATLIRSTWRDGKTVRPQ